MSKLLSRPKTTTDPTSGPCPIGTKRYDPQGPAEGNRFGLLICPGGVLPCGSRDGLSRTSLRISSQDDGVTIQCRCGHFSLSFHSIAIARQGHFRCLICGLEEAIADLIDADGSPQGHGNGVAGRDALR